jgi:PTH1 family peptidyl-tRNA hydrolase
MDYLIVGLGNPGTKYEFTRHNVGFDVVDEIAKKNLLEFKPAEHSLKAEWNYKGKKILLLKPQTFMNLSGKAVNHWLKWYKIPTQNLLIIVDDIALPVGKLRYRASGSPAGHNGLKDIQLQLGTEVYNRLKFGVGNDFKPGRQADFVLSKFNETDRATVNLSIDLAMDSILFFIENGMEKTMGKYN